MSKKKSEHPSGIIYSTNPDFKITADEKQQESVPPAQQKLKVLLDTKQRRGKSVTLVTGFTGTEADAEELGKKLKTFCGTGGSVKDYEIIIQGDQRDKVFQWLKSNGYTNAKRV